MKKILMLTTGGTIASSSTDMGLAPKSGGLFHTYDYNSTMKTLYPMGEFEQNEVLLDWKEVLQMDSTDIAPTDWYTIAKAIYSGLMDVSYDGIVVTHGTDTMAYSLAAVGYLLSNVNKPVVFTGSQLPMEAAGTDAVKNLTDAIHVACSENNGLYLVFAGRIIDATSAKKVCTQGIDAFVSVNKKLLGCILQDGRIEWAKDCEQFKSVRDGEPALLLPLADKIQDAFVPCIKLIPGLKKNALDLMLAAAVSSGACAAILEVFGMGGIPDILLPAIEKAIREGLSVYAISQCIYDGTDLSVYEVGIKARQIGVESAGLMTFEALSAKLILDK